MIEKIRLNKLSFLAALAVSVPVLPAIAQNCNWALNARNTCQQPNTGNGCHTGTCLSGALPGDIYTNFTVYSTISGGSSKLDGQEDVACYTPVTCSISVIPRSACIGGGCVTDPSYPISQACGKNVLNAGTTVTEVSSKIAACGS